MLAAAVARTGLAGGVRDVGERPYTSWDDALDDLAARAVDRPVLLVLDEFHDLVGSSPRLPALLRAFLDRSGGATNSASWC